MSSFFTLPASQKKRKRAEKAPASAPKRRNVAKTQRPTHNAEENADDESISGSDSSDNDAGRPAEDDDQESVDDETETAAERRLKLAERYLDNIRVEVRDGQDVGFDAADLDREIISARLKDDVAEEQGRVYRHITESLDYEHASRTNFRADTLSVTGIATSGDHAYAVSKDCVLSKWELKQPGHLQRTTTPHHNTFGRKRPKQVGFTKGNRQKIDDSKYQHHALPILCVTASADGRFVVTGGAGHRYWNARTSAYSYTGRMIVWDAATLKPLKVFNDHRDAVTCVAFRGKTNQLFSGSRDRTLKVYSLNELAYVETLFGHQDEIMDVSAVGGSQERCVSVGARDRTARLWKVVEETQLILRAGGTKLHKIEPTEGQAPPPQAFEGSLDRVVQVDSQLFVTGADNGDLALFGLHKKKPLHIIPLAHGYDPPISVEDSSAEVDLTGRKTAARSTPRPITALSAVPFSDMVISGSWDGCVHIWKIDMNSKRLVPAGVLGRTQEARDSLMTVYGEKQPEEGPGSSIRGVINDLACFERGERGKDGVCIVAALGKELAHGAWRKVKGGRNGCVVFEIPHKPLPSPEAANGLGGAHDENDVNDTQTLI